MIQQLLKLVEESIKAAWTELDRTNSNNFKLLLIILENIFLVLGTKNNIDKEYT